VGWRAARGGHAQPRFGQDLTLYAGESERRHPQGVTNVLGFFVPLNYNLDKYRLVYLCPSSMQIESLPQNILRRHIALPTDHGSWVFLFSPLLIGLFAGGQWSPASFYLILAAVAAFLIRQPATILVKVYSHRRSKRDLSAAWFWMAVYAFIGLLALSGLVAQGYSYLLSRARPGLPCQRPP